MRSRGNVSAGTLQPSASGWGALDLTWTLNSDGQVPDHMDLLRAICLNCGFVAWFKQRIPEVYDAVEIT